jgi:hypothetical protein
MWGFFAACCGSKTAHNLSNTRRPINESINDKKEEGGRFFNSEAQQGTRPTDKSLARSRPIASYALPTKKSQPTNQVNKMQEAEEYEKNLSVSLKGVEAASSDASIELEGGKKSTINIEPTKPTLPQSAQQEYHEETLTPKIEGQRDKPKIEGQQKKHFVFLTQSEADELRLNVERYIENRINEEINNPFQTLNEIIENGRINAPEGFLDNKEQLFPILYNVLLKVKNDLQCKAVNIIYETLQKSENKLNEILTHLCISATNVCKNIDPKAGIEAKQNLSKELIADFKSRCVLFYQTLPNELQNAFDNFLTERFEYPLLYSVMTFSDLLPLSLRAEQTKEKRIEEGIGKEIIRLSKKFEGEKELKIREECYLPRERKINELIAQVRENIKPLTVKVIQKEFLRDNTRKLINALEKMEDF